LSSCSNDGLRLCLLTFLSSLARLQPNRCLCLYVTYRLHRILRRHGDLGEGVLLLFEHQPKTVILCKHFVRVFEKLHHALMLR